ncbi:MAG TPA: DASS family sodium-coupled anion symporter [Gemmatimonadaceae bacterium]|nr:DASS family sodium-coupled anion symporter [Gemmatimonadaceae bacterium]
MWPPMETAEARELDENADGEAPGKIRARIGYVAAPALFLIVLLLPLPGLSPEAHRLAAIMSAVVVLWITEAIPMPVTAIAGAAACVIMRVAPAREVFAPFADPLMFLFIGSFILARAIMLHGLDRRLAFGVLSLKWVGASPTRILLAFGAVTTFISAWISNTATTAMMYAIALAILSFMAESDRAEGRKPNAYYPAALMLMTSFAASIGGMATPIGTPPNVIGLGFMRRLVGVEFPFFKWMMLGVPVVLVMFAVLFMTLRGGAKGVGARGELARTLAIHGEHATARWSKGEVSTVIAFGLTVFLWVLPGFLALAYGDTSTQYTSLTSRIPEGVAAIIGASLLFLLPGNDGQRAITWPDAVKIDWGIVLLYGGGFALGVLSFQTGLAEALGRGLLGFLPSSTGLGLLIASTLMAAMLSEVTSNTASANMVVPVVISIAKAAGADPLEPALGATMGASLGFMLPVSTPCNAIVYGSGYIPLAKMIRYGIVLDVVGVVVIVTAIRLLVPLIR